MKHKGGYNLLLQGRPGYSVKILPEPEVLYMPLKSPRFHFTEICVKDGSHVDLGEVLAKDPDNYGIPLLASRSGTVRLDKVEGHIVLEDIIAYQKEPHEFKHLPHIAHGMGTAEIKRLKMQMLGAWEFFFDAYTGALPDPLGTPQAVIISTLNLEPFVARGDVQLQNRLLKFTRGLEHLQSLLEYQPIYLVMPDIRSAFASRVREQIRGYAWVNLVEIPLKYPFDNFNLIARSLGLKQDKGPIWSIRSEGILAIDRVLTLSRPSLVRIVSVGGPDVEVPTHIKTMPGYPLQTILEKYAPDSSAVINGGMLTGSKLDEKSLGLDSECRGLTILPSHAQREFLGFIRPGWDRSCYAECFLSSFRKRFTERFTDAMRGEGRPCVSCNFCEEVCPAGIMPHLIHKYLYNDLIEEADQARVDLCIQCGLCSFVCPSKIELTKEFLDAKDLIETEKEEALQEQLRQQKQQAEEQARREASKAQENI